MSTEEIAPPIIPGPVTPGKYVIIAMQCDYCTVRIEVWASRIDAARKWARGQGWVANKYEHCCPDHLAQEPRWWERKERLTRITP